MFKRIFKSPVYFLKAFASLMYFCIGIVVIATPRVIPSLDTTWRLCLGILLVAYGLFRLYRIYLDIKQEDSEK